MRIQNKENKLKWSENKKKIKDKREREPNERKETKVIEENQKRNC